jgi:hypothetical protein
METAMAVTATQSPNKNTGRNAGGVPITNCTVM